MRLNQYLAKSGITSRRKAEELIKSGKITLNNNIVFSPYRLVKNGETVKVDDKKVEPLENIYLMLNKPKGVTSTCSDKFAKKTVLDLIPKNKAFSKNRLYPVGRLDKNSTGLLILTNDGSLCYQVTHPKFEIEKEYILLLFRKLTKKDLKRAISGIHDKKETGKGSELLKVKTIKQEKKGKAFQVKVTLSEGKKRHIRRLFGCMGYEIKELKRIRIGNLTLGNLEEGEIKTVKTYEIKKIFNNHG